MDNKQKQKRIDFTRVETWLVLFFGFLFIFGLFSMKILGASELPKEVEKEGYCKLKYGVAWQFDETNFVCRDNLESQPFSQEDFKLICQDHKIFSKGFNSECFILGRTW